MRGKSPSPGDQADATTPQGPGSQFDARELARQARAGCRSSFEQLVRRFAGPLRDYLRTRVAEPEIDDLVQESFLSAWRHIERYDERWSFSTWLFTIAHRQAISSWRRQRPSLVEDNQAMVEGREDDPSQTVDAREASDNLWNLAREVLSPDQYGALWLSYAEGAGTAEIAKIIGRARPTVRVLLFRARASLRQHLRSESQRSQAAALTNQSPTGPSNQPPAAFSTDPPSGVWLGESS